MGTFIDLTGQRFGMWVVIKKAGYEKGATRWWCICDCGQRKKINSYKLRNGLTKSCGCLSNHGHTAKGRISTTYHSWKHMKERCLNPKNVTYKYHGARGISICDRWLNSFKNFLLDMGEKPQDMTIERIDNNGNYEPDNCMWATRKEQARNTRKNKLIEYEGKTMCISAWEEELGIKRGTLWMRLKRGHSPQIAFNM